MLYGIIVVVVVVLDQATKAAVRHLLDVGESAGFIPGVLDLKAALRTSANDLSAGRFTANNQSMAVPGISVATPIASQAGCTTRPQP